MLFALCCRCANSEPRMRTFLKENHHTDQIKIAKGRSECLNFLETLPYSNIDKELDKLKMYIKRQSSWSVIIGTDGTKYEWADLGHSSLKEKLDSELIIEKYGGNNV